MKTFKFTVSLYHAFDNEDQARADFAQHLQQGFGIPVDQSAIQVEDVTDIVDAAE